MNSLTPPATAYADRYKCDPEDPSQAERFDAYTAGWLDSSLSPVHAGAVPAGWMWMTHPSRMDGRPFPVRLYFDADGNVSAYAPWEEGALEFEWDERDEDWRERWCVMDKATYVKSQGQTRNHHCHWPGCDTQCPPAMWGCRAHWFKLPKTLRDRIWLTYRPGQEKDGKPSAAYIEVAKDVQAWITARGEGDGNG